MFRLKSLIKKTIFFSFFNFKSKADRLDMNVLLVSKLRLRGLYITPHIILILSNLSSIKMDSKLPYAKNDTLFLSQNVRLFLTYKPTPPPLAFSRGLDIKL